MSNHINKNRRGFTLVEIMIAIFIIGLLLAIAIPSFIQARDTSRKKTCIANMAVLQYAKSQFAMDKNKDGDYTVAWDDITSYVKTVPTCPSDGTYSLLKVNQNVSCTYPGHPSP